MRQQKVALASLFLSIALGLGACGARDAANRVAGRGGEEVRLAAQWPVEGAPDGIAVSSTGEVYVTINNSHRVVRYGPRGELLAQWPVEHEITAIAAGPEGLVYIADWAGSQVLAFQAQP